jgi:hypothetical protein
MIYAFKSFKRNIRHAIRIFVVKKYPLTLADPLPLAAMHVTIFAVVVVIIIVIVIALCDAIITACKCNSLQLQVWKNIAGVVGNI